MNTLVFLGKRLLVKMVASVLCCIMLYIHVPEQIGGFLANHSLPHLSEVNLETRGALGMSPQLNAHLQQNLYQQ